jgi:hypothetical protein
MKISNTSRYPTAALTFLVRHIASLLEVDDYVYNVRITNCRWAFRGRCWGRDVLLRIGPAERYPLLGHSYPGLATAPKYDLHSWIEGFVTITAHEFQHSRQYKAKIHRKSEIEAERTALYVLEQFRLNRQTIMAQVEEAVARDQEKISTLAARRQAKAATIQAKAALDQTPPAKIADLERKIATWTQKKKLAETYLRKYQRALRRQERRLKRLKPAQTMEEIQVDREAA